MTHHCHAVSCSLRVPPRMLFCLKHWRALDSKLQKMIWAFYREGQERRKDPSAAYLIVQAMAVGYVAVNEGLWTRDRNNEHCIARIEKFAPRLTDEEILRLRRWLGSEQADLLTHIRSVKQQETPNE